MCVYTTKFKLEIDFFFFLRFVIFLVAKCEVIRKAQPIFSPLTNFHDKKEKKKKNTQCIKCAQTLIVQDFFFFFFSSVYMSVSIKGCNGGEIFREQSSESERDTRT